MRVNGSRTRLMGEVSTTTRMGRFMKDNGLMTSRKARVRRHGLMVVSTKAPIRAVRNTDKVDSDGLMVLVTRGDGLLTEWRVKVSFGGQTGGGLRASTEQIRSMGGEHILGLMEGGPREYGTRGNRSKTLKRIAIK